MLLIYEVTSATDAKNYFASCLSPGRESTRQDYYSEGQESPGRFGGKLAARLGIAGQVVDKERFERLCDNLHPVTGESLTPRTNDKRRVAYELTFSGPKSFSIAEAFAEEEERRRLVTAFDESAAETVACDIEPDMMTRDRKGGVDVDRPTGNILTSEFDHLTARPVGGMPPDMHRHKHLLIHNATFDAAENRIKAGQFGTIVRDKGYYEAAFYSRLAAKLEGLGYVIDRRGGKQWEIAGMSQSLIDKFSKRTDQIDAAADALGITDAKRKSELGAKVRAKKQKNLTMGELRTAWDAQLTDAESGELARVHAKGIAPGQAVTAAEAVGFAIDHASEKQSVIPERELKRVALLHGLGSLTPGEIDREMLDPSHGLIVREFDGQRLATTRAMQEEERFITGVAARGLGTLRPAGVPPALDRGRLNDGQWQAVTGLLDSQNRFNLLLGPAGAGKTDLLKAYAKGMRLAGKPVGFFATSSDAVGVLKADGFADAKTVAHLLLDEKLQASLKGGHIVCDEASMLGHKDAFRLFSLAEKLDLKITLVGDAMQHGSVSRGAFLRVLTEHAGIKPFRLSEIMRQKQADDGGYQVAARQLAEGNTLGGFSTLDGMGWIKELGDDERVKAIAADYCQALADKKSVLVVSPTHHEAAAITHAIRSELKAAGTIGADDHAVTRLVAVDTSEAERGQASTYRGGPLVLVFHQNAKGGITKGDRLAVSDAASVPLGEAAKFSVYRPVADGLAVGDVIRFTGNVKTLDGGHLFKNGQVRTVKGVMKGGNLRLDDGRVIAADAGFWRHGRVETSFGSQGKTVQRVILGMASPSAAAMNQEQMYVSSTRGKERLTLYTDDKEAVRAAIQKSSQKLAALDLGEGDKLEAAVIDRLRRHRERQRRLAKPLRVPPVWQLPVNQQPERQVTHGRR